VALVCHHLLSVPAGAVHLLLLALFSPGSNPLSRQPIYLTVGLCATLGEAGFSNIHSLPCLS